MERKGEITSVEGGHDVERVTTVLKNPYPSEMYQRNARDKLRAEIDVRIVVAMDMKSARVMLAMEIEESTFISGLDVPHSEKHSPVHCEKVQDSPDSNACLPGTRVDKVRDYSCCRPFWLRREFRRGLQTRMQLEGLRGAGSRRQCRSHALQPHYVPYKCHSGHNLDGTPVENESSFVCHRSDSRDGRCENRQLHHRDWDHRRDWE